MSTHTEVDERNSFLSRTVLMAFTLFLYVLEVSLLVFDLFFANDMRTPSPCPLS